MWDSKISGFKKNNLKFVKLACEYLRNKILLWILFVIFISVQVENLLALGLLEIFFFLGGGE